MADTLDLGSSSQECGFKSRRAHQHPKSGLAAEPQGRPARAHEEGAAMRLTVSLRFSPGASLRGGTLFDLGRDLDRLAREGGLR